VTEGGEKVAQKEKEDLEDLQKDGRIYFVICVTGLNRFNARKYDD
jgi:hypothetical protein